MNIRDLQYVIAVAEQRNFSKAAEHCCVSQPTLSGQIQKLEASLGAALFERAGRSVQITEFGEQVLVSARRVMHETARIKELAESASDPFAGRFRLGAFPTLATYVFPQLVAPLRSELPNLKLILQEAKTAELVEKLKHGELDAALLALPVHDDSLVSNELFRDPFYLAVWPGHGWSQRQSIHQSELASTQLLLLEEGHCLRDQALDICSVVGADEEQDFRATGLETLRQMVRAETGITLMPRVAKNASDGLCYLPFEAPEPNRCIGLVSRKKATSTLLTSKVAGIIRQVIDAEPCTDCTL